MKMVLAKGISLLSFVVILSACTAPTEGQQGKGLSEDQVRKIVDERVQKLLEESSKNPEGMTDEQFFAKVEKGIDQYIQKQEEDAKKAQEQETQRIENYSIDDDPGIGDPNAPVTIIEFSDFQCPFCGRHFQEVYSQIKEKYIDTGKVRYVFRDLPLIQLHQNAMSASVAANCALQQGGEEAYFKFHDEFFLNQQSLGEQFYKDTAKKFNLNMDDFDACIVANDTSEIENDMKDAQSYGMTGTPGFLINGWPIRGAYPFDAFQEIIERELSAGTEK